MTLVPHEMSLPSNGVYLRFENPQAHAPLLPPDVVSGTATGGAGSLLIIPIGNIAYPHAIVRRPFRLHSFRRSASAPTISDSLMRRNAPAFGAHRQDIANRFLNVPASVPPPLNRTGRVQKPSTSAEAARPVLREPGLFTSRLPFRARSSQDLRSRHGNSPRTRPGLVGRFTPYL